MQIAHKDPSPAIHLPYHSLIRKWYEMRQDDNLPTLEDFRTVSFELKDYRMVSELITEPLTVVYIEAGMMLETLYGNKIVGKNLDTLYNSFFRQRAYEGYRRVIEEKLPAYEQRSFSTIFGKIGYYKLHLPFADNGGAVKHVVTYIMPTSGRFRKRWDWEKFILRTPWLRG